jgi:hypothetical protein
MNKTSLLTPVLAAILVTGCNFQNKTSLLTPTAPTSLPGAGSSSPSSSAAPSAAAAASVFSGSWASSTLPGLPGITSCADVQWSISSLTDRSVAGTVSAVCGGGAAIITADLTGQLNGADAIDLTANGSAVAVGITCSFQLTGIGHRETADSVRLDYEGMTCLGPVSGSEMLRRASPAPPPPPAPQPEPQPGPGDPVFGCGGIQDNLKLVQCIHGHIKPTDERGAFEVTKRVAWALRDRGGAGLLIKPSGENIVAWRGYSFSASRICYPDGHLYKVITDVGPGGANGPGWQNDGFVDRNRYVPAIHPELP